METLMQRVGIEQEPTSVMLDFCSEVNDLDHFPTHAFFEMKENSSETLVKIQS
jgi:hypothetical protein